MYLDKFVITNFLSHKHTEIHLKPISVFVGPINSGKSAIFDALINFSVLARGRVNTAFGTGPFSFPLTRNRAAPSGEPISFGATVSRAANEKTKLEYRVGYRQKQGQGPDDPHYEILSESLYEHGEKGMVRVFERSPRELHARLKKLAPVVTEDSTILAALRHQRAAGGELEAYVAENISRLAKYRMQSYLLRQTSDNPESAGTQPWLNHKGDGLSAVLWHLQQNQPETLQRVVAAVKEVVVGFDSFEFNITRVQELGFSAKFNDGRGTVSAGRLSDGTLQFIGLAVLLLSKIRPKILCLEEPEIGLNSLAMSKLVKLLRDASTDSKQPTQILVSTHSPYLLKTFWTELDDPLHGVFYVRIENGASAVSEIAALQGINHFDKKKMSISFAANLLDGMVNPPEV